MVEGAWLERLKEFIKIDIKFDSLIKIQINNNNSSNKDDYREEEGLLSTNIGKASFVEKNKIKEILKGAHNDSVAIISNESQELIKDIKLKEAEPDVKSLLKYFRDKIPAGDYIILRSAIYIDKLALEHKGYKEIHRLRGEVGERFGGRGTKIINLYARGYFKTIIKPLVEEFSQQGFFNKKNFLHKYNIIIEEEAFAIFVPDIMDGEEVKNAIKIKLIRNLKYGKREVTIHSIGKHNVAKVREAISVIEEEGEYPVIKKDIEETENTILAKLWF